MKKNHICIIALAVTLLLVLAFCSLNRGEVPVPPTPTETPTEAPTEAPTESTDPPAPTEPEWTAAIVRADRAEGIYDILGVGTEVQVVGQFEDYYVIAGEEYDLLVEKRFIRLENEDPFVTWTGYAKSNAELFDTVYMRNEPIGSLRINTALTVLEGKDNWLYVQWADGEAYMLKESVSMHYINTTRPESGGGSSGGSSQTPVDGTDVDIDLVSSKQTLGGIVPLGAYYGPTQESGFEPGKGTVIAHEVESYLILPQRDAEVKVTEFGDSTCTVWLENELYFKLPKWLLRPQSDEQYASWTGYSSSGAVVYKEYQLRNEKTKLNRNAEVVILDEIPEKLYGYYHPGCYVVLVDGEIGYMSLDCVRETKYVAPAPNYGGDSSGSSSSGAGDTWTPPVL